MALVGAHASAAMSPALWGPVLDDVRPGWMYEAWDVTADDLTDLRHRLLAESVVAVNVTMPHKRWAASAANTSSASVIQSGAANLLMRDGHRLSAHNTDIDAMRAAIERMSVSSAVLVGAGGAGRAAIVAMAGHVERVEIVDPSRVAAMESAEFASRLGIPVRLIDWHDRGQRIEIAELAVNATPVGMQEADPPVWGTDRLDGLSLVYDFVYAPHDTANVRVAQRAGVAIIDGWQHLLRQAQAMVPLLGLPERATQLLTSRLAELRASRAQRR